MKHNVLLQAFLLSSVEVAGNHIRSYCRPCHLAQAPHANAMQTT